MEGRQSPTFEPASGGQVVPLVQVSAARYVTIELAAAMTGLSPGAIRTKITKGVWLEGRLYVRREGRVFVDMRGYERWVEQGQA